MSERFSIRCRRAQAVVVACVIAASFTACAGSAPLRCPGEFDPSGFTRRQLERHGTGDIPVASATTFDNVRATVENRHGWIEQNYPNVVSVDVGDGWGVSYTNNKYGDTTFHRRADHMIVVVVKTKADCPDPARGQLMLLDRHDDRVPVRFVYASER